MRDFAAMAKQTNGETLMDIGHNERAVRLAALLGDARIALDRAAKGEAEALDGWIAYGAALNEGRALFPSDEQFGQWVVSSKLEDTVHPAERAAAMWAAANKDQFEEARAAGNARTVRGIHKQWKDIEKQRQEAERKERESAERKARAEEQKKVAEGAARAEEEARQQAKAATSEEEVAAAEALAAEAAEVRSKAEQEVAKAEAEEQPDPHADLRREFRALTDQGREEDWIGLRLENAELRDRIASLTEERDGLKERVAALSEENQGAVISKLYQQLQVAQNGRKDALAEAKRLQYRTKLAEQERDEARRDLEGQMIPL